MQGEVGLAIEEIKKQLDKIESVQDKHQETLANIDKTLAVQAQHLEYHIKRTTLAEENIELLRQSIEPIRNHYHFWGIFRTILITVASIIGGIYSLINMIKK